MNIEIHSQLLTLIARVRMVAITSSEPPNIQLSFRVGSYSQMAVDVSTAAIFVIRSITGGLYFSR